MKIFRIPGIKVVKSIKNRGMDHKKKLEELNKESLKHFEEYLKSRGQLKEDEHVQVVKAHDEWQAAWNKFMETLMVLERLEL